MKTINFKWSRGCMWDAEGKTTTLVITEPEREAEMVLEHLKAEGSDPTVKASLQTWSLDSWEVVEPEELGTHRQLAAMSSDDLFNACVAAGGDRAAVAGWPDNKRRRFILERADVKEKAMAGIKEWA